MIQEGVVMVQRLVVSSLLVVISGDVISLFFLRTNMLYLSGVGSIPRGSLML